MIVLIAPEEDVLNEIGLLNKLFHNGLECFHLRKPLKSYQQHVEYLNQIDIKYHNKIVVHDHHKLINEYNLKGIHFQEQKRIDHIDNPGQYFKPLNMFGKTISSSFHDPEVLADCEFEFDYHLLSPIFNSISKQGYQGQGFDVNHIDKYIIGMGGINSKNISKTLQLGYKGIGILGAIWNTKDPVNSFITLKQSYNQSQ
ncbi:thiamine phosphate synthase [Olleya sp. YSTF-M6]|uniref:Thiamine phosphate synthase n=1 Tax=Olleya sediminilitoris TaxID=2795739 RepID=A0ABS1WIG3_9FLAO|nr:thiamine phosphate synthase [Olleya sediminilitoris]MBL7558898.1 thiamine phosphate synthase [Olleya sediminilitoris]